MITRFALPSEFLPIGDRVRKLEEAFVFAPIVLPVSAGIPGTSFGTTLIGLGGITVDRDVFRKLLPDAKWYVYAAGFVDPGDANTATISLAYVKDDASTVVLGTTTKAGSGWVKFSLGPFDVFGTTGVPAGETIACVRLTGQKNTGANGTVEAVCIWTRFLPSRQ